MRSYRCPQLKATHSPRRDVLHLSHGRFSLGYMCHSPCLLFPLKVRSLISQTAVPVVTKLRPVVVRLAVGVTDQADALDLLISVLGGHM